jgi:hypothetical protein
MINVSFADYALLFIHFKSFHLFCPIFYSINVAYCDDGYHFLALFLPRSVPDPEDPLLSAPRRSGTVTICADPDPDPSVYKQKTKKNLFLQYWDFLATCYLDTEEKGPEPTKTLWIRDAVLPENFKSF